MWWWQDGGDGEDKGSRIRGEERRKRQKSEEEKEEKKRPPRGSVRDWWRPRRVRAPGGRRRAHWARRGEEERGRDCELSAARRGVLCGRWRCGQRATGNAPGPGTVRALAILLSCLAAS